MAMPERKDSRREALLTDPAIVKSIRSVLHLRGVRPQDLDDHVQQVLEEAWVSPALPLDDREEARRYLCGMARFKAIDDAHRRAKSPDSLEWLPANDRIAPVVPFEERDLASTLAEKLAAKYPRTFSWFVRSEVHDEQHAAITHGANLSPGYVRSEVAGIRRSGREMARTMGVAALTLVLLFIGVRALLRLGDPVPVAHPNLAPYEADDLRLRATKECDAGEWKACADDLDKANALDAAGETDALRDLREKARQQLAKPPAPPQQ
jgi:DNA-directed RNA polymerase specialized sigma24 family protein